MFFFCRLCYHPVKGESKKLIVVLVIIFFFFQERISELGDSSVVSVHFRCANGTADNQGSLKNTKFQNRKRISRLDRLVFFSLFYRGSLSLSLSLWNVVHSFRKSKWKFRESSGERVWALHIRDERTSPFLHFNFFGRTVCVACFVIPGWSRAAPVLIRHDTAGQTQRPPTWLRVTTQYKKI